MRKHFKIITCIILMITILSTSVVTHATSIPVGIDTDLVTLGEFTSWVMLMFGVHDNNANSNDMYYDTDFIDMLNNETWRQKIINTELQGKTPKQVLAEMYQKYQSVRYKVEMTHETYDALASAIADTFQGQTTKAIRIYNESSIGEYTEQYVLGQMNNIVPGIATIASDRVWQNYWANVVDIEYIYVQVQSFDDYGDYTSTHVSIYLFENEEEPTINNNYSITYKAPLQVFDGFVFNTISTGEVHSSWGNQYILNDGTTQSMANAPVAIMKDTTTAGLALIDAGIKTILDTGDATIVTPYTGVNENEISIPVPSINMDKLVTDVKTGVTTATQAIAESQSVVADKTDTQAMADAVAITASNVPQFETFSLASLFPFCIPFDLRDFLFMFVDEPKTPEFNIKLPTGLHQNGELVWYEQHVDLHQFDTIAQITRDIEFVLFCIGLIMITRNQMIRS